MKKTSLIIFLLLVPAMLFAAPPKMPESQSVTIKVSGTRDDEGTFDIGFSSNPIKQWSVLPIHFAGNSVTLSTKFLSDGSVIGNLPYNALHVYWRVVTRKKITLSLAQDGPMMNSGSALNWVVSWTYGNQTVTLDSSKDKPDTYKTIQICQALVNVESIGSSTPLSITTEALEGKLATGSYTGNLKLKIEVAQ